MQLYSTISCRLVLLTCPTSLDLFRTKWLVLKSNFTSFQTQDIVVCQYRAILFFFFFKEGSISCTDYLSASIVHMLNAYIAACLESWSDDSFLQTVSNHVGLDSPLRNRLVSS